MYRGTTPTLTFRLPIDTGSITVLSLAVAQAGQVKIEKALSDVQLDGNVVSCTLTEAETLSLTAGRGIDGPTPWDYLITNSRISVLSKISIDDLPVWNDLDWSLCI